MFLSHTHIMNNHLNNKIIENASKVSRNLSSEELYEISHKNGEGKLSKHGALVVETGKHTGRSANDKFFVKEDDNNCLLYTSPSPRDRQKSRMPSSA